MNGSIQLLRTKVKPCPFCGCIVLVWRKNKGRGFGQRSWKIRCAGFGCGATMASLDGLTDLVRRWNRRSERCSHANQT